MLTYSRATDDELILTQCQSKSSVNKVSSIHHSITPVWTDKKVVVGSWNDKGPNGIILEKIPDGPPEMLRNKLSRNSSNSLMVNGTAV